MEQKDKERFYDKTNKTDECWLWLGSTRNGYGLFSIANKIVSAHRWSYEIHIGPIDEGTVIHHTCAVRNCVNPDHLQATTHHDNNAEMMGRKAYEKRIRQLEERVEELEYALNKQLETVTSLRARTNRLRRIHS